MHIWESGSGLEICGFMEYKMGIFLAPQSNCSKSLLQRGMSHPTLASSLAYCKAGGRTAARTAIAVTTISSARVKV